MNHSDQTHHSQADQLTGFQMRGVTHCPAFFAADELAPARALVIDTLQKADLWHNDQWAGGVLDEASAASIRKRVVDRCKKSAPFRDLMTPAIQAMVQHLSAGAPTSQLLGYAQLLFTPPNTHSWSMPNKMWHLDAPRLASGDSPGVQMFVLLDDVAPMSGGTLVVAGSHRLLNDQGHLRSKDVKQGLQRWPWFRRLLQGSDSQPSALGESFDVDGIDCAIVELSGQAGDVFFTDLRLLHTVSANAGTTPRMMATQRFVATEHMVETYGPGAASRT